MKTITRKIFATVIIMVALALSVKAQVSIQTAISTGSICQGNWTALTDIAIVETAKNDFAVGDTQTLILTLPLGYEFNPAAGISNYALGRDIKSIFLNVTASKITLTYSVATAVNPDAIIITGLGITCTADSAISNDLTRDINDPGTAVINGAGTGTVFGTFMQGVSNTYTSAAALAQDNNIRVDYGSADNLMMRCIVYLNPAVNGCNTSLTLENMVIDAKGSSDPINDLTGAHIYYTGNSGTFGMNNEFGSFAGPLTAAPIQINGSQLLNPGNNFFWITFDVSPTATYNNTIDCSFLSADVSGVTKYTATPNPPNTFRHVGVPEYISAKSGNWNDPTTWVPIVPPMPPNYPTGSTHARILNGHTVTLTGGASVIDLTVDSGGVLNLSDRQLVQFGEIFCHGAVNSTPKSRLYIGDFDRVRPTYKIPAGITTLQKLVVSRAFGASCDHDLRIGDVCPTVLNMGTGLVVMDTGSINGANNPYPPLWLSSGVLTMKNGAVLRMENTDSLPYKIACSDLTYVDGIISRHVRNDDKWHEFPAGNGGICRKAAVSRKPGAAGITEVQFINQSPPNGQYVKTTDIPGGIIDKYYWRVRDISGGSPKRMFYYKDVDFPGFTDVIRMMCLGIAMNEVATPTDNWHVPTTPAVSVDDMVKYVQQINNNASGHTYWTLGSTCLNSIYPQMFATTAGNNSPLCEGSQLELTASTIIGATYSWTGPNGFTSSLQNPIVSADATLAMAGTYSVFATINGDTTVLSSTMVYINPYVVPAITGDSIICPNDTVLYCTDAGKTNYQWTVNGGTILGMDTSGCITVVWGTSPVDVCVTYSDASGCISPAPTCKTIILKPPIVPAITGIDIVCAGDTSMYCTDAGKANYQWTANGGTIISGYGTECINVVWGLNPVSVCVTYTDTNGCSPSSPTCLNITLNPPVVPVITGTGSVCPNSSGNVYCTQTGMTNYLWTVTGGIITSGQGTDCIVVTWTTPGAQSVCVSYTDPNGCFPGSPACFNVTVTPNPVADAGINQTICTLSCVMIGGSTTGGTPPFTYNWSPGGFVGQFPFVCPTTNTTYTLTVTDANGCTATDNIYVNVNPNPVADAGAGASLCSATTLTVGGSPTASGGTPWAGYIYGYNWSSNPPMSISPTANPTVTVSDTTEFVVVVTDSKGCADADTVIVYVNPSSLSSSIAETHVLCFGESTGAADLTVTGGCPPYSYYWSTGSTYEDMSNMPAGTYSVTVTDANGSTATNSVTITQPSTPLSVSIAGTNILCNGASTGAADLTVTGGTPNYAYLWSNAAVIEDLSNLPAGFYCVTVTDANACTATACVTITQPPVPLTVSITGYNVLCNGNSTGAADLTATGGIAPYTYMWSNNTVSEDLSNIPAGIYYVTVTDAGGCSNTSGTTIIQPSAPLSVSGTVTNVLCSGGSDGSAVLTVSGGTPPCSYQWNPTVSAGPSALNLTAGIYNVTVTDANACTATSSVVITEPLPLVVATSNDTTICSGQVVIISASATGGAGTYYYTWNNGLGAGNAVAVSPSTTSTYIVTVTDVNGCTATDSLTVTVSASITLSLTSTDAGCPTCANGTATANASGGAGIFTYLWNTIPPQNTATATNLLPGTYTLCVGSGGCSACDSVTVSVASCSAAFTFNTNSGNNNVHFINTSSANMNSWHWDFGDGDTSHATSPAHNYVNDGFYNVCLTAKVVDTLGNVLCSDTTCRSIYAGYPASFCQANFFSYLNPDGVTFQFINASNVFDPSGITMYSWDFGDGTNSFSSNPAHVYSNAGTYNVCLSVFHYYTFNGVPDTCFSTYCKPITVTNTQSSVTFSIQGTVHAGGNPASSAAVILFNAGFSYYNAVDYRIITNSDNGNFQFDSVAAGLYILYAIPDISVYPDYLPAYYGDVLYWQNAHIINVIANTYSLDIHLVDTDSVAGHLKLAGGKGNGSINGTVTFDNMLTYETGIFGQAWFGKGGGSKGIAGKNIPVFLKSTGGAVINWALANESGDYSFTDIDYGDYTVNAEKASLKSFSPVISLTQANPGMSNVNINIGVSCIVTSVPVMQEYEALNSLMFYPNPVKEELNIAFILAKQSEVDITLYNITGQEIMKYNHTLAGGANNITLDAADLNAGLYVARIFVNKSNAANFKFVK